MELIKKKNHWLYSNNRMQMKEERITELEDRSIMCIQSEEENEKRLK